MAEGVLLAQLARAPVSGQVKTRLLPRLGAELATALHAAMVEHVCSTLCDSRCGTVELWVDGTLELPLFRRCLDRGATALRQQQGADLGQRMAWICEQGLGRFGAVILVGSDAPSIDPHYIADACAALERSELVLGPALDGGYVLIGMRRYTADIFVDMPWGTDRVLAETLARIGRLKKTVELLPPLPDIDRPEDLHHLPEQFAGLLAAAGPGEVD